MSAARTARPHDRNGLNAPFAPLPRRLRQRADRAKPENRGLPRATRQPSVFRIPVPVQRAKRSWSHAPIYASASRAICSCSGDLLTLMWRSSYSGLFSSMYRLTSTGSLPSRRPGTARPGALRPTSPCSPGLRPGFCGASGRNRPETLQGPPPAPPGIPGQSPEFFLLFSPKHPLSFG